MGCVFRRELKGYFTSMMGYVFIAFVLLFFGIYTTAYNLQYLYPAFEYVVDSTALLYLIGVPVLTMRVFAEERRQRTDQLLYALPLPLSAVVLGKYAAMIALLAMPTALVCLYPLVLSQFGTVSLGTAYASLAAFFLQGCALIAIGMFLSSVTESQIVAAVLSFGTLLLCFLMNALAEFVTGTALASVAALTVVALALGMTVRLLTRSWSMAALAALLAEAPLLAVYKAAPSLLEGTFGTVMGALAVFDRTGNFMNGIFDWTGVVYFLSVAGLFVFFTVQSLEKRRWS